MTRSRRLRLSNPLCAPLEVKATAPTMVHIERVAIAREGDCTSRTSYSYIENEVAKKWRAKRDCILKCAFGTARSRETESRGITRITYKYGCLSIAGDVSGVRTTLNGHAGISEDGDGNSNQAMEPHSEGVLTNRVEEWRISMPKQATMPAWRAGGGRAGGTADIGSVCWVTGSFVNTRGCCIMGTRSVPRAGIRTMHI